MSTTAITPDLRIPGAARHAWTARPWHLALLGIGFAALVLSRKPGVLLHATLWGDDGWSWYPDAYNLGIASLAKPMNGYLNTFQRLIGLAVQPFPLAWVPTLFAAAGLAMQVAPALFLVSGRMAKAWPQSWARLAFALIVLVLPNELDLYVNLTNSQWHLALLAFLVLVSTPPETRAGWIFDALVLLLCGLSGPFCLLLAPVAIWQVVEQRSRTSVVRAAILGGTALVQVGCMLGSPHARSAAPLGAGPRLLARIVALDVLLGAQLGFFTLRDIPALPHWQDNLLPIAIAAAGAVLGTIALLRGPPLLRKFALFAGLVFVAALASPQVSTSDSHWIMKTTDGVVHVIVNQYAHVPQWMVMTIPPMGNRYYTFPMLAWIGVLFTLAADRRPVLRGVGLALLAVMLVWAIPHDWRQLRFPPTDFVARARAFAVAPRYTVMEFPVDPPGLNPMFLLKH
ncbi:MAG: hypothetical protein JO047_15425 [Alphaproteobacteria bacterium]|nr:hypothetical protein [Alphaproteobacteria bacterium]